MGTKSTKKVEPAAPAAKPAPKRKVGVRPPAPKAPAAKAVKPAPKPVVEEKPVAKAIKPAPVKAPKAVKAVKAKPAEVPAPAPTPTPAKPVEISTDTIALRAYFISEARQAAGLPGSSETDWIEAESQIRSELGA